MPAARSPGRRSLIVSPVRRIAALLMTATAIGGGATLATASSGVFDDRGSAAKFQYRDKPGCGPDRTDGVAGASGQHLGQPPKEEPRQDCPDPPGQQR